jgi:hypothetical protein
MDRLLQDNSERTCYQVSNKKGIKQFNAPPYGNNINHEDGLLHTKQELLDFSPVWHSEEH